MDMPNTKLTNFERIVLADAKNKRNIILEELSLEKKRIISEIKSELKLKAEKHIKNESIKIIKAKNERIAHVQFENKLSLLAAREDLINSMFEDVIQKLTAFTKSEDYVVYLKNIIANAKTELSSEIIVILSKSDSDISRKISDNVTISDENFIGGCIIKDEKNNIQVDHTFSSALQKAKEEFLEKHCIII